MENSLEPGEKRADQTPPRPEPLPPALIATMQDHQDPVAMNWYGADTTTPTSTCFDAQLPGTTIVYRGVEPASNFGFPLSPTGYRPPTKRAPIARRIGWNGKPEVLHPTKGWRRA